MCNPDSQAQKPGDVAPGFLIAKHLLDQWHKLWLELAEAKRVIARLESGEHRFTCRQCEVAAWSTTSAPPPSWYVIAAGPAYYCQDCAAGLNQGQPDA